MKLILLGILWMSALAFPWSGCSNPYHLIGEGVPTRAYDASPMEQANAQVRSTGPTQEIDQERPLQEKIYVVIGVFAVKGNAIKFTEYAKTFDFPAEFALNPTNNLYYVYLFSTTQMEAAEEEYDKVLARTHRFPDLWIFNNTEKIVQLIAETNETTPDTADQGKALVENIYVVAGAFSLKSNAIKFSQYTTAQGYPSDYSLNPANHLYYVYLYSAHQLEAVKKEYHNIKSNTSLFPDLWIFNYKQKAFEKELKAVAVAEANTVHENEAMPWTEKEGNKTVKITSIEKNDLEEPKGDFKGDFKEDFKEDSTATKPLVTAVEAGEDVADYVIYPNVVDARSYKEIKSSVEVIDPARAKLIKTVEAHQLSTINDPGNSSHALQFIAQAFGYRKVEHNLDLTQLHTDSLSDYVFVRHDTILIEFPMVRLRKGDIVTMYNVFFHNDAAVMLKRSTYELNGLVTMLEENPDYRIRIHGHTNGNRRGKIIELQEENPDFFTITDDNKRGTSSAKKLSEERAITIKRYLMAKGIAEDRMEVKGWGGRKMIYEKNSLDAKKNVRVEVEILED